MLVGCFAHPESVVCLRGPAIEEGLRAPFGESSGQLQSRQRGNNPSPPNTCSPCGGRQ